MGPTVVMNSPAGTSALRAFSCGDRIRNREDVLERRVPSGPVADKHDVVVRVDNAGNDRLPHQIDRLTLSRRDVIADCGEAAVADQHLRDDAVDPCPSCESCR